MNSPRAVVLAMVSTIVASACSTGRPAVNKQEWVRHGDELVAQAQYGDAVKAYRPALEADPDDTSVRTKLADAYLHSGDAIRASDLLPESADLQVAAASAELRQGHFADAADRMSLVLRKAPNNVGALVVHANATAHLWDSGGVLFMLAEKAVRKDRLDSAVGELHLDVLAADNSRAETELRKALALAPANPDVHLAVANFLWSRKRLDEAEVSLRVFLDHYPLHPTVNHALGAYYLARGRNTEALPLLETAARVAGEIGRGARFTLVDHYLATGRETDARQLLASMKDDDAAGEVSVRLAALEARDGKPADAVRHADDVLARVPGHRAALLLKAQVLFSMCNPDTRFARAAATADAGSSEAALLLAKVLLAAGDSSGALAAYTDAAKLNPDSIEAAVAVGQMLLNEGKVLEATVRARDALRLAPESKDAAVLLVRALAQQKNYAEAERVLAPVLAKFPNDRDVLIQSGNVLTGRGNDAAARAAFQRALQTDGASMAALSGLVSLEIKTKPTPETVERVERLIATRPRDVDALFLAAQLHAARNDMAGAERTLRTAFEVDSSNVQAGQMLAHLLARGRRTDDALAILKRLLERRPGATAVRTSLAMLLEDVGRVNEAMPLYEQVVQENPSAADVVYRLGALYLADPNKMQAALDLAAAAKKSLPNDAGVNNLMGRVYTQKGLTWLALPALREAVAAEPRNALYRYYLGNAQERAGNMADAREEYARALDIDGTFPGADHARTVVGERR